MSGLTEICAHITPRACAQPLVDQWDASVAGAGPGSGLAMGGRDGGR